jgi:hypothetical protein
MRLSALLVPLLAMPARADVDGSDPSDMVRLLREAGYVVTLGRDSVGDPKIDGRLSRTDWTLLFYNCTEGADCRDVQFSDGYDLPDGISFSKVNEWNRTKRFGQAFTDAENDPYVQLPVNLFGGVSDENFLDTVDWWRIVVQEFEDHIEW